MDLILRAEPFLEAHAQETCNWLYEGEYAIYNYPPWPQVKANGWGMADPEKRLQEFVAVYQGEQYVGFIRFVRREKFYTLGLGLRPDCCGQGIGKTLMLLIKDLVAERGLCLPVRLSVRTFNKRAIQCYRQAGFRVLQTEILQTPLGEGEFFTMELQYCD